MSFNDFMIYPDDFNLINELEDYPNYRKKGFFRFMLRWHKCKLELKRDITTDLYLEEIINQSKWVSENCGKWYFKQFEPNGITPRCYFYFKNSKDVLKYQLVWA